MLLIHACKAACMSVASCLHNLTERQKSKLLNHRSMPLGIWTDVISCIQLVLNFKQYMLVQEVGSYRPAVRPERRRAMQQETIASAPHALQMLGSCLDHKGEQQANLLHTLFPTSQQHTCALVLHTRCQSDVSVNAEPSVCASLVLGAASWV